MSEEDCDAIRMITDPYPHKTMAFRSINDDDEENPEFEIPDDQIEGGPDELEEDLDEFSEDEESDDSMLTEEDDSFDPATEKDLY